MLFKKCFTKERSKGFFVRENLKQKRIVKENALNSDLSLMHYKGRPSNYLFQLFLTLLGRPEQKRGYFSNVQPCTIICTLDAFI